MPNHHWTTRFSVLLALTTPLAACNSTSPQDTGAGVPSGSRGFAPVEALIEPGPAIDPINRAALLPSIGAKIQFDGEVVELHDPRRPHSPGLVLQLIGATQGNHDLDLTPRRTGLGDCLIAADPNGCPRPYHVERAGLSEWWVVGETGIEQGFVIEQPHPSGGPLMLEIAITGSGRARPADGGAWIQTGWGRGWSVRAPVAWDALGLPVSTTLEVSERALRIWVDPAGATWPVTVDPIYSSASQVIYPQTTWSTSTAYYLLNPQVIDHTGDGFADLRYSETRVIVGGWQGLDDEYSERFTQANVPIALRPTGTDSYYDYLLGHGDFDGDGALDDLHEHNWYRIELENIDSDPALEQVWYYLGTYLVVTSFTNGTAGVSTPFGILDVADPDIAIGSTARLDANGDGLLDLLVYKSGYGDAAATYTPHYDLHLAIASGGFDSEVVWSVAASEVSNLPTGDSDTRMPDLNDDGYQDLIFRTPSTQSIRVVWGGADGLGPGGESSFDTDDIVFSGSFSRFAPAGDYTGDGIDDLAYIDSGTGTDLIVIPGGPSGPDMDAAFEHPAGLSGTSTSALVGDLGGDGLEEFMAFGAYTAHFVNRWGDGDDQATLDATDFVTVAGSRTFEDWAAGGDINGDGTSDLVLSQNDVVRRLLVFNGTCPVDLDGDLVCDTVDCDDSDPNIGHTNSQWYADLDGDGLGAGDLLATGCYRPEGAVDNADDCDDGSAWVLGPTLLMKDNDGDDFHNGTGKETCEADNTVEYRSNGRDCNDNRAVFTDSCSPLAIARRRLGVNKVNVSLSHAPRLSSRPTETPIRMRYANTSTRPVTARGYTPSYVWRLLGGEDGLRTVYGWYTYDDRTIVTATDTVLLDRVLPTDGEVEVSMEEEEIFLQLTDFSDDRSGLGAFYLYENSRGFPTDCSGTEVWSGSDLDTEILLQDLVNGEHHYYRLCAEDNAGNLSPGVEIEGWAALEGTPPTLSGGLVTDFDVLDGEVDWRSSPIVDVWLDAADEAGVPLMCINTDPFCRIFQPYAEESTVTLPRRDGLYDVYLHVRDGNGNPAQVGPFEVGIDLTPPRDAASGRAEPVEGGVVLYWEPATDASSGVVETRIYHSIAGPPACGGGELVRTLRAESMALGEASIEGLRAGVHYFRICAEDAVGNISRGLVISGSPAAESNAPTLTASLGGSEWTNSRWVNLAVTADDDTGVARMCVGFSLPCTRFVPFTTSSRVMLPAGDGLKTLQVVVRDSYGNVSEPATPTIRLDATPPTDGTASLERGDGSMTLSWEEATDLASGVTEYRVVRLQGATPAARCATGEVIASDTATTAVDQGLVNGQSYTYRVCAVDLAGNVSTGSVVTGRPSADRDAPEGTLTLNGGAAWTNGTTVTATLSAVDASVVTDVCVSLSSTCTWIPMVSSLTLSLGSGDGNKTFSARFRDEWGNESEPLTTTIGRDRARPVGGTLLATAGTGEVSLSWSGFSDALSGLASYRIVAAAGSTAPGSCAAGELVYEGVDLAVVVPRAPGNWSFRACAVDQAGNLSTGVTRRALVP